MRPIDNKKIKEDLSIWLDELAYGLEPGRFRFCLSGSSVPTIGQFAQFTTCFAMKIAWQTGIWDQWSYARKESCIKFIQSFQKRNGFFFDPWLAQSVNKNLRLKLRFLRSFFTGSPAYRTIRKKKLINMRAETRQSASTLLMVGTKPKYVLPLEVLSLDDIRKYIDFWDWRFPWSAGSHLSHLIFFLSVNKMIFNVPDNYEELISYILNFLNTIRDPGTGTWFVGDPSDYQKINGAMKILSGFDWINNKYPDCTSLIDFALRLPFAEDGCGFLDRLYVLQQALKGAPHNYRIDEIRNVARKSLERIYNFKKSDGGFSFFPNRSQNNYYGVKVSKGYPVGDLHGSVLITWAIAIALDLLGEEAPCGFEYWRCHKP